jgi:hypothetical protein
MDRVKKFVNCLIQQRISRGHNFEVAWSLWIAKQFKIEIPPDLGQQIIDSRDVISILILLDMQDELLVSYDLDLTELKSEMTEDNLSSELWLLVYEANRKRWIKSKAVSDSSYFNKLESLKISFYESDVEIEIGEANVIDEDVLTDDVIDELKEHLKSTAEATTGRKRKVKVESTY